MPCHPDLSTRIERRNIVVKISCSIIVSVLVPERCDKTCRIACISRRLTVTNLSPEILASLATATTEEQVIVDLVICSCLGAIEYGGRCSFEADHDSRVCCIRKNMSAQSVRFPTKIFSIIETSPNIHPLPCIGLHYVRIRSHPRKAEHCFFIRNVGAGYLVNGPV